MGLTHTYYPSESFSVLMCCMHVVFSCCMKFSFPVLCLCCILVVKKTIEKKLCVIFFRFRGMRSGILYYNFPHVEHSLVLLCSIFCEWNALWRYCVIFFHACSALWRYCVIFSACGTRSSVIVLYFLRVERALVLLCYIFCVWNAL